MQGNLRGKRRRGHLLVRAAASALVCSAIAMPAPAVAQLATVNVDIRAQSLAQSLMELSRQANVNVVAPSDLTRGRRAPAVRGTMSVSQALDRLLANSGLTYRTNDSGSIVIGAAPASGEADAGSVAAEAESAEIVVTGSRIPGAANAIGQTIAISRAEIAETGLATVESFFESRPENFSAFSFDGNVATNSSALQGGNLEGTEGIDLRGLGPQSTLVLVNGQRRAGAVQGRVVDISAIPLSLIDRVDIVTGGHSAIYGADAVAGVVNFILRRSYDGAQTQVRYGDSEHDGGSQLQFSQVFGREFERGGVVIAYDYIRDHSLDLLDTGLGRFPSIFGITPQQFDLAPDRWRHSIYGAGTFSIGGNVEVYADAQYIHDKNEATRNYSVGAFQIETFNRNVRDQFDLSAGARFRASKDWTAEVSGNYSLLDSDRSLDNVFGGFPAPLAFRDRASLFSLSAVANGTIPLFGSFEPRVAIGVEYREEGLNVAQLGAGVTSESRSVKSIFGEVLVPFSRASGAGIGRLDVTLAARYDDYSDFGGTFNPQVGAAWEPLSGLKLRASYSTAFRAPSLRDTSPSDFVFINNVNNPTAGGPPVPLLIRGGNNPNISAERADTWVAGIEFSSPNRRGTRIYASYFDIRYNGRLDVPAFSEAAVLQQAERYVGLLNQSPSQAELDAILATDDDGIIENSTGTPFDPVTQRLRDVFPNIVVFDNRLSNIGVEAVNGIDFGFTTAFDTDAGRFSLGLDGTYTLDHDRSVTATSPSFSLLNDVGLPPDLRMRGNAGWRRGEFSLNAFVNYTDSYRNTRSSPASRIKAWTTLDLVLSYRLNGDGRRRFFDGFGVTVSAVNLLGERPPVFLQNTFGLGYDTANANAIGRYLSIQITKDW